MGLPQSTSLLVEDEGKLLGDFETRLADVMGSRLAAPLAGAVDVSPGRDTSRLILGITSVLRLDDDLLSRRPELVPGDVAPRRVLRLRCTVVLDAKLPNGGSRSDQIQAIDEALYLLEDNSMRDGSALLPGDNSDPGFLIRGMTVSGSVPPQSITIEADGFFWPKGTPGQLGPAIQEARIRSALEPLVLDPQPAVLAAGGPAMDFTITFGTSGTTTIAADGIQNSAYGTLVASLVDAGGRPGRGTLSGGVAGPNGSRIYTVTNGSAALSYSPPAQPATEFLVVKLDDSAGGPGIELARFPLRTRSS
jgi:hypothetical protein